MPTGILSWNVYAILPLASDQKVAFIGKYAKAPRYQGGGSSHVNSFKVESALDALETERAGVAFGTYAKAAAVEESQATSGDAERASAKNEAKVQVTYAQGFDDAEDQIDEALMAEAVEAAKNADVAVIFAGLPDSFESEGYDRKHMRMPDCQNALIEAVAAVQPNTVVVLHNGSPIEMPWIGKVKAVLETYLGGEAVGGAVIRALYGLVNPSGHLAETFPLRLQDTPCYLTYGVEPDQAVYSEGVFVGYRYYASKEMEVLFPFGHGLSYTTFAYSNLRIDKDNIDESETLTVTVDVTNTGAVTGKEVVQLYVSPKNSKVIRPVRELRAFDKIELTPGETKTVSFVLGKRAFAFWDTKLHDWKVESGAYEIQICRNAQEVVRSCEVSVKGLSNLPKVFTLDSTLGEIMRDPKGQAVFEQAMAAMGGDAQSAGSAPSAGGEPSSANSQAAGESLASDSDQTAGEEQADAAVSSEMMTAMMDGMPLRKLISFVPGLTKDALRQLVMELNA